MTENGVVRAEGRLTDWVSLGVLASFVPRNAVDDAVAAAGKQARRPDGNLPPHVMVYLVMALALFPDDDYQEVAARLTETLASWGCWDDSWSVPTSGGITQPRQRPRTHDHRHPAQSPPDCPHRMRQKRASSVSPVMNSYAFRADRRREDGSVLQAC
jgi:Insertion element 4 transposase N-terminal